MAKKAELDILDVPIDEKNEESLKDDNALAQNEDKSSEQRTAGEFLSRVKAYVRKPLCWIIMISVVLLGSTIMGISIWLHNGQDTKTSVTQGGQAASETIIPAKEEMVLLTGFVVDLKDGKDNIRIAFCDIVLEPEKIQTLDTIRNHAGTRSLIYGILKSKKVEELLSPELRIGLKTDLKNGLNSLLGETLVKNIYFSRLELI